MNSRTFVPIMIAVKPILAVIVFLCFAVMFGIALLTTSRRERRDEAHWLEENSEV